MIPHLPRRLALALLAALAAPLLAQAAEDAGWQRIPLVTGAALDAGARFGGEGCQWPYDIQVDAADGEFALFTTDVGGMWRSLDGGATWEPCNVGHLPRGSSGVRIDPHFPGRVLSDGMNSMGSKVNGLYLSEDHAASWRPVFQAAVSNFRDRRQKLAWDPTTRDDEAGMTRVVYWSRTEEFNRENWGDFEYLPGLYRSDDGGRVWARLNEASCDAAGHSALAVDPATGRLFAGNDRGVFASDDRGETFRRVLDRPCTSLAAGPDSRLWMTRRDGVMTSEDGGETWAESGRSGLGEPMLQPDGSRAASRREGVKFDLISVSPADPDRVMVTTSADDYRFGRHVSHDGGRTWATAAVEPGTAFMPQNAREGVYAWHPTDPDRVLSFGGDWPTASRDGGRSFQWSGDGQNAIYIAGRFNVNPHHEGLWFLPSQDYNGGVTVDGGATWRYTPVSGEGWGGFCYGGLAVSPEVVVTGLATGGWSSPRVLQRSVDGGSTWGPVPDAPTWVGDRESPEFGEDSGFSHPGDPTVAFAGPLRTADGGRTWERMTGCSGVFTADASGRLYGGFQHPDSSENDVVRSADGGGSWEVLMTLPGALEDAAATPEGDRLFVVTRNRLWKILPDADRSAVLGNPLLLVDTPPTGTGHHRVRTVAVDPRDGSRVFAGQRMDTEAADVGVLRSTDGGATWENLTRTEPLADGDPDSNFDGGREPQTVRVDPHTGDLLVTTGCFGVWRHVNAAR